MNTVLLIWDRNTGAISLSKTGDLLGSCHQKFCEENRCEAGLQHANLPWIFLLSSSASLFTGHLLPLRPGPPQSGGHSHRHFRAHLYERKELPSYPAQEQKSQGRTLIGPVWVTCPSLDQSLQSEGILWDIMIDSPHQKYMLRRGRTNAWKEREVG